MSAEAPGARVWLVVFAAVAAMSSSALLVRGMEAQPLAMAAWRTALAAVVLSPTLLRARPSRSDVAWSALAGVTLGVHFWAWFESVHLTTVQRSTLLVCLTPGWTALLEWALAGRRPTRPTVLGLAVSLPGVYLLGDDRGGGGWWGDALALFAGLAWSAYLLVGRRVREHLDAGPWMALVCAWAGVTLFALALAGGVPLTTFPATTWGLLALAVALPQLVGHQGFAWAVRYVPPATLGAFTLLEPVGATLLAAPVFGEYPTGREWVAMVVVLAGTFVATRPVRATG